MTSIIRLTDSLKGDNIRIDLTDVQDLYMNEDFLTYLSDIGADAPGAFDLEEWQTINNVGVGLRFLIRRPNALYHIHDGFSGFGSISLQNDAINHSFPPAFWGEFIDDIGDSIPPGTFYPDSSLRYMLTPTRSTRFLESDNPYYTVISSQWVHNTGWFSYLSDSPEDTLVTNMQSIIRMNITDTSVGQYGEVPVGEGQVGIEFFISCYPSFLGDDPPDWMVPWGVPSGPGSLVIGKRFYFVVGNHSGPIHILMDNSQIRIISKADGAGSSIVAQGSDVMHEDMPEFLIDINEDGVINMPICDDFTPPPGSYSHINYRSVFSQNPNTLTTILFDGRSPAWTDSTMGASDFYIESISNMSKSSGWYIGGIY